VFPATLFDYNGVLVDDEALHLEAFRDALAPLGIELTSEAYVERYLGFDDRGAFEAILKDAGRAPTEDDIERLIAEKEPLYRARASVSLPTFAGAAELVARRAAVGPVVIVSGALRDEIALGLRVLGVTSKVDHIVSAEDTLASKPDPEGYELGLEYLASRLDADIAARALVIEDSLAGVQAAKAAGLPCAAVTHSYDAAALRAAGADLVVATLQELTDERLIETFEKLYG
jgi:beta-phosphoglucomutase-like phosphatase (HAD superfamily)